MITRYILSDFSIRSGCYYFVVAGSIEMSFINSVNIQDQTQTLWPYTLEGSVIFADELLKVRFINDTMPVLSRVEPLQYVRSIENSIVFSDSLGGKNMVVAVEESVAFSDSAIGSIIDPNDPVYGVYTKEAPPETTWTKDNGI